MTGVLVRALIRVGDVWSALLMAFVDRLNDFWDAYDEASRRRRP